MPEMHFQVRWPDGSTQRCYSPSLVVKEYLTVGESYPVESFVHRSRSALEVGSRRVQEKYGFRCTGAAEQLAGIERMAAAFSGGGEVKVESFDV